MLPQLSDGRMIIVGDLIGQREVGRIEDAGLGAKELEKPRRFLHAQAGIGALPQGAVEKENPRRGRVRSQAERRAAPGELRIKRGEMIGFPARFIRSMSIVRDGGVLRYSIT